ncbi:MAG TPA: hypothetical protein VHZ52_14155, partial [Acidobacteriaceae bacterium]|nr:hypothetical protein [Acidobacteriaceae bacterium]
VDAGIFAQDFLSWSPTFEKLFKQVFGDSHLTLKCFWRSAVASLLTGVTAVTIAYLHAPEQSVLSTGRAPTVTILRELSVELRGLSR